jgi:hypothetical protein
LSVDTVWAARYKGLMARSDYTWQRLVILLAVLVGTFGAMVWWIMGNISDARNRGPAAQQNARQDSSPRDPDTPSD